MSRVHDKRADALATLSLKVDIPDDAVEVKIMKRTLRAIATDLIAFGSFVEPD